MSGYRYTHLDASECRALANLLERLDAFGNGLDGETSCYVEEAEVRLPGTGGRVDVKLEDGTWVVTNLRSVQDES